jgi:transcriptional regulator with XRE-family HTH domain
MTAARAKLGAALRAIRDEMKLTLADVSSRTGLATSTLSKVENGHISLTYDKLVQLSEGLQLDFNSILTGTLPKQGGADQAPRLTARRSVTRAQEGLRVETRDYDYLYLSSDISKRAMVPILITVRARSSIAVPNYSEHSGEEFFYVLQGPIEMRSEHYEPVLLQAGDSMYFDSTMKHVMLSASDRDGLILDVCCTATPGPVKELIEMSSAVPIRRWPAKRRSLSKVQRSDAGAGNAGGMP